MSDLLLKVDWKYNSSREISQGTVYKLLLKADLETKFGAKSASVRCESLLSADCKIIIIIIIYPLTARVVGAPQMILQ